MAGSRGAAQGDGTVAVHDAYLRESILTPSANVEQGFTPAMPQFQFSEAEINAPIAPLR